MQFKFLEDCAADDCNEKIEATGLQMCQKHQRMYEIGSPFKGFYGKTVLKKEFHDEYRAAKMMVQFNKLNSDSDGK